MQSYQFEIMANHRPETLERILRVIRHRGFLIQQLQVDIQQSDLLLTLQVQSERHSDLLHKQLMKLIDISQIKLMDN